MMETLETEKAEIVSDLVWDRNLSVPFRFFLVLSIHALGTWVVPFGTRLYWTGQDRSHSWSSVLGNGLRAESEKWSGDYKARYPV